MTDVRRLDRLLSCVKHNTTYNCTEGLDPFRDLLEKDADGKVLQFLQRALKSLRGQERGGIAWLLAGHYAKCGLLAGLEQLYATPDEIVQKSALNGLWDEPGSPQMAQGIVALAVEALAHAAGGVRAEACRVIQNQAGWRVDVSTALAPLKRVLADGDHRVRHMANYCAGNLAKRRYDLTPHLPLLGRNLTHSDLYVRDSAAWALHRLSQSGHDIGPAIADLAAVLAEDGEYNEQRKRAAGALIHHARKSKSNARQVKQCVRLAKPDSNFREVARLLEQLASL